MTRAEIHFQRAENHRLVCRPAFTLTEAMISILIVMVLATGAMGYQYFSARDVKHSEVQTSAAQIAMLLLESWKGAQGDAAFNPLNEFAGQLDIQTAEAGPSSPENMSGIPLTPLGFYTVRMQGVHYYLTPAWDAPSISEPMLLNVTIAWRRDYAQGRLSGDEPFVRYSTFFVQN
ncbi:MAG: hypothetical protein L0Y36_04000 [Planctomycetales bacterium]|nr:hypothetical protein [Planctomycetales bacterium]